jgi:hypothetical protein
MVAEVGVEMSRFPTVGHLLSWAGAVPTNRRERRQASVDASPQGGAPWVKSLPMQCVDIAACDSDLEAPTAARGQTFLAVHQMFGIQVLYRDSGRDLTAATMAQIIFEEEKRGPRIGPGDGFSGASIRSAPLPGARCA